MVQLAIREMGVRSEDCIYVGDSDVDLETARQAGLPCVSVLWGFRDRDFLLAHGATTFVEHPREILELIHNGKNTQDETDKHRPGRLDGIGGHIVLLHENRDTVMV